MGPNLVFHQKFLVSDRTDGQTDALSMFLAHDNNAHDDNNRNAHDNKNDNNDINNNNNTRNNDSNAHDNNNAHDSDIIISNDSENNTNNNDNNYNKSNGNVYKPMQIFVKPIFGRTFTLVGSPADSIASVKESIYKIDGTPPLL